jgi:hypothetical protein
MLCSGREVNKITHAVHRHRSREMSAASCEIQDVPPRDQEELVSRLASYTLTTSSGTPQSAATIAGTRHEQTSACWQVALSTDGYRIRRDIWLEGSPWDPDKEGWQPEGVIWPTWPARPADESQLAGSPLAGVHECWSKAGDRLRDSAKWMAAVLGAALATVVGSSPLAAMKQGHSPAMAALVLSGLVLLSVTLFLVMQVMRPQAVSYHEIQKAHKGWGPMRSALGKWRTTVESHEDLYLPSGVRCLTSLRQSMIIEEATLAALAQARAHQQDEEASKRLIEAQTARAARLHHLRVAAAQIETIGDYYRLRARSTRATYGGILCGLLGSAAIIAAFAWPLG